MDKCDSEIIYNDMQILSNKYNPAVVFTIAAIAVSDLMGLENWKNYLNLSLRDTQFQKLIMEFEHAKQ